MKARALVPLLLLLPLLPWGVQGQGPVAVFITAPDAAGTGDTIVVNVTAAGGPAEEGGTYELRAFLRGPGDLTGASPVEEGPLQESSENNTFSFNVTMPLEEQEVELVVVVNSTKDDTWVEGEATKRIRALVPLRISARVVNTGSVEVRNVPVYLYLDGTLVDETALVVLGPSSSVTVSFRYLPVNLAPGSHTLEIRVDINGDGVVDPALGEVLRRVTFVREAEPINPLWIILGAVGAFVAALFVGGYIRQRRRGR